ncbi:MFS transporter [Rhizobium sp. AG855]|uniref:MFS transporter n=1 Tax=Rhizobium sp. AG855 TaxID=2183898 RepID=UPI000E7140C2|nr:MFS transporter [Rhizobium sp. AG855]RKE85355.1 MFS transporter [Rhizobium sp. AG855]
MSTAVEQSGDTAPTEAEQAPASPPAPPPAKPLWLAAIYVASGLLMFITQGLGMNIVNANLYQLQGQFSATAAEAAWLSAAYVAPYATLSLALFKVRAQYGLRPFAEWSILIFVLASLLNLFVSDLHSALVVRFISGCAGAPISSLGFLYVLEAFPAHRKLSQGLNAALMGTLLAAPIARMISPGLLEIDGWHALYTLEVGLALVSMAIIFALPVTAPPRAKVIERMDIVSYLLMAVGIGCLAVFLTLGRLYWWFETWWLGVLLICAIGFIAVTALIESRRTNPMLDFRWIFSRDNLHMAAVLLVFRAVSSEQSSTAVSFFQQIGLLNDQQFVLWSLVLLASIGGALFCMALMSSRYVETAHVIALALIAGGAYLDSQATNLTRPEQMYLSQGMIAFGAAMFLPPVMAKGFGSAMQKGLPYVVNFIAIFLFTQITGSMLMTSLLGSFVSIREKFHSNVLVENILLTRPEVAQRVSQLAAAYRKVITDPAILNAEGLTLLSRQVTREAYVLAYTDTFLLISVVTTAALAVLLVHLAWRWLRTSRRAAGELSPQS